MKSIQKCKLHFVQNTRLLDAFAICWRISNFPDSANMQTKTSVCQNQNDNNRDECTICICLKNVSLIFVSLTLLNYEKKYFVRVFKNVKETVEGRLFDECVSCSRISNLADSANPLIETSCSRQFQLKQNTINSNKKSRIQRH